MKGLIQRVSSATVTANGEIQGDIGNGLVLLLGIEAQDTNAVADKLLSKVLRYRVFEDTEGKMNRSLQDVGGELAIVSQFTLAANTRKGLRPSFSKAASPELSEALYLYFVEQAKVQHQAVVTGIFAADMTIQLVNRGPVTFLLEA